MFTFLNGSLLTRSKQNRMTARGKHSKSLLNQSIIYRFAHGARGLISIPAGRQSNIISLPAGTIDNICPPSAGIWGGRVTQAPKRMFPRMRQSHVLNAINKKDVMPAEGGRWFGGLFTDGKKPPKNINNTGNSSNWILNPLFSAMGLFGGLWPTATNPQSMPSMRTIGPNQNLNKADRFSSRTNLSSNAKFGPKEQTYSSYESRGSKTPNNGPTAPNPPTVLGLGLDTPTAYPTTKLWGMGLGGAAVGGPTQNNNPKKNIKPASGGNKVVSITYEEIGLFPRSFSRVIDRFLKQIFSDVENLVIQEYRFYRYLFLTTIQTIFVLLLVPLFVNFLAKTYIIRPVTEYFWNTKQTEIFLNSYEQKRAFLELQDFEEKLFFESLLTSNSSINTPTTPKAMGYTWGVLPEVQRPFNPNPPTAVSLITEVGAPTPAGIALDDMQSIGQNFKTEASSLGALRFGLGSITDLEVQKNYGRSPANVLGLAKAPESHLSFGYMPQAYTQNQEPKTRATVNPKQTPSPEDKTVALGQNQTPMPALGGRLNAGSVSENIKPLADKEQTLLKLKVLNGQSNLLQERLQEKTIELAIRYNNHSIESITNFFADFLSLLTLLYLLVSLEIKINITKSFLLEVFFGLDDSKKSLLILIMTDLLVGYHSSNLWELFFQFLFNHYGIPESQTGIFLLVATLPVLLDVLFKYLIFRHLNRASPATVATYHAIIE